MPGENKEVAIRKRQQIDSSKKTMFLFVASAAFLSGIAVVVSIFLIQQIVFHSKVIIEKQTTISRLDTNIENVNKLKDNVRVLETDAALKSVKLSDESSALQTILDALPDTANADALGASVKSRFIDTVDGITINNLMVSPVNSEEATGDGETIGNAVNFSLEVTGDANKLKELLTKFERSIRVIELSSFEVQAGDNQPSLIIQGLAHYEPAQIVQLQKKVVKP